MQQQFPPPLKALLDGPEESVCLAEAALLLAAAQYPDLDVPTYLERIDGFAAVR
jgi:hypothetical protein